MNERKATMNYALFLVAVLLQGTNGEHELEQETVTVGLFPSSYTVAENVGTVEMCVVQSCPSVNPNCSVAISYDINFSTMDETADDNDYIPVSMILTFNNERQKCLDIIIIDDLSLEFVESFKLTLTRTADLDERIQLIDREGRITISENEATARVGLERTVYTVSENEGEVEVCAVVFLPNGNCPIEFPFDIRFLTSVGTADASDFQPVSTNLLFERCANRSCTNIPITSDMVLEETETFDITLERTLGLDSRIRLDPVDGVVNILDALSSPLVIGFEETLYTTLEGDAVVVCLAALAGEPLVGQLITVNYASSDRTATAASDDYSEVDGVTEFSILQTQFCFNVTTLDDDISEGAERFIITSSLDTPSSGVTLLPALTAIRIIDNETPLLTTPLPQVPVLLERPVSLCYQIHGESGQYFNLITFNCTTVSAHWVEATSSLNVIDRVAVHTISSLSTCHTILVDRNGCSVSVNGGPPSSSNGKKLEDGDVLVRRRGNVVVIKVPNCAGQRLVMRVECNDRTIVDSDSGEEEVVEMLKLNVSRSLYSRYGFGHGLIGQFYYRRARIQHYSGPVDGDISTIQYTVTLLQRSPEEQERGFIGNYYDVDWLHRQRQCLYAGSSQAGYSPDMLSTDDSVIAGLFEDYRVSDPFNEHGYSFGLFNSAYCD